MPRGPLEHPALRLIQEQIECGDLQRAQQLLAGVEDTPELRVGTSYLATRLLFQRGRLDQAAVIERLRDLLKRHAPFPEAEALLETLEQRSSPASSDRAPDVLETATPFSAGAIELTPSIEDLLRQAKPASPSLPSIPKAPAVPNLTPPPDFRPSYAPEPAAERVHTSRATLPFGGTAPQLSVEDRKLDTTQPPRRATQRIRSGPPPAFDQTSSPSVVDIAGLLDAGHHEEALASLDRVAASGPDQQLLRGRALHAAGRNKDALRALEPLCQAPLLEPELRGSCARLLLEIEELDAALDQAERAQHEEPESLFLRLTLALCKLRVLRRTGELRLVDEAAHLLEGIQARNVPLPALVLGLRACIQAHTGDADRAVSLAQRALSFDSHAADALWAMSLASLRLNRPHDAKHAFLRLLNVSLGEARLLRKELLARGAPITDAPRAAAREGAEARAIWPALENDLAAGKRAKVVTDLNDLATEHLRGFRESRSRDEFSILAGEAAAFFTRAPVWQHFAPYDLSLWSVRRVAVAIDLLYGTEPLATAIDDQQLALLMGSYVGEVLRLARGAVWSGSPRDLDAAAVVSGEQKWRPFELVSARLRRGLTLALDETVALTHPGTDPWNPRVQTRALSLLPWAPRAWPEPQELEQLGRALPESVIGMYCREIAQSPLDSSFASLRALDHYLALIAPLKAPVDGDPAWVRRVAMLLGAYLGETLREAAGGRWHYERCAQVDADAYVVVLADVRTATPITQVMARVIGDTSLSLSDYASRLLRLLEPTG